MSEFDFDDVVPDWDDVEENDEAEPDDISVEHTASPEEVAAVAEEDDE